MTSKNKTRKTPRFKVSGSYKKKIRRKVVCVWGELDNYSEDFVLEPYFEGDESIGEVFWIEAVEDEEEE